MISELRKKENILHIKKQIEYTKKLLDCLTANRGVFAEVCKKYDGKVYTKRFANAVSGISPLFSVDLKPYGMLEMTACDWNNRGYVADVGQGGYICTSYVANEKVSIFLDSCKLGETSLVLNAETMLANFDKHLDGQLKGLQNLIDGLEKLDKTIAEFSKLKSEYETFTENTNYRIRELFGMKL